jgi:hypothetical protein
MTPPADHAKPIDPELPAPPTLTIGGNRYQKAPYAPPKPGSLYAIRDKAHAERIIRIIRTSPDGARVAVEAVSGGTRASRLVELPMESLARQGAKGWCSLLIPVTADGSALACDEPANDSEPAAKATIRLDIQNFGRCCADIARANIKFSTQLIKDVGDGPFRAGNYQQAFITFEQLAVSFGSAVSASRRAIADGRRALIAEKGNLSGKEIQERTTAFIRNEQLINSAERSFAAILEGLRVYLRTQQV